MDIQDELPFDRDSIPRCDNSSPSITGDELIEDWPHNKEKTKQVRISESAALRVYQNKDSYSQIKSYTSRERKEFGRNTIIEAAKIRKILSSMSDRSDYHRVMNHLGSRGVSTEEIVGIEQFVLLKAPHDVIKERRTHARSILLEQEKQRIMGLVDDERLALISSSTSKRAAVQARIRAGGAA
ncbi:hypothetical protein ACHAXS_007957 [Conticribra weissflogii]